jgi:hypothetical protein
MTMRLFSAPCSCSVRASPRLIAPFLQQFDRGDVSECLDDLPVSVVEVSDGGAEHTHRADCLSLRSRCGKACADRRATKAATGVNLGQRWAAALRSALTTGVSVRNASWQGPSLPCTREHLDQFVARRRPP